MVRKQHRWLSAVAIIGIALSSATVAGAQDQPPPADELPLPQPRPTDGAAEPEVDIESEAPAEAASTQQLGPRFDLTEATACEATLRRNGVRFERLDPIDDGGGCGTQRPLEIAEVGDGITISGNVRLRCQTALALHEWVDQVVVPSAQTHLGTDLTEVRISTSYQCRRRNNAATGKLSEHAFANGVDVMAFVFEDRPPIPVTARPESAEAERAFQAAARGGACAYFTTVLGPGSDAAHNGHFHLDLAERSSGYRICQ